MTAPVDVDFASRLGRGAGARAGHGSPRRPRRVRRRHRPRLGHRRQAQRRLPAGGHGPGRGGRGRHHRGARPPPSRRRLGHLRRLAHAGSRPGRGRDPAPRPADEPGPCPPRARRCPVRRGHLHARPARPRHRAVVERRPTPGDPCPTRCIAASGEAARWHPAADHGARRHPPRSRDRRASGRAGRAGRRAARLAHVPRRAHARPDLAAVRARRLPARHVRAGGHRLGADAGALGLRAGVARPRAAGRPAAGRARRGRPGGRGLPRVGQPRPPRRPGHPARRHPRRRRGPGWPPGPVRAAGRRRP